MTIQVGHPHKCPTFFCAPSRREVNGSTSQRVNESTSQQVNKSTGQDRSYKPDTADADKCKSPFLHFFAKYMRHLRHISIIISVRYNLTDRKNRPFGLRKSETTLQCGSYSGTQFPQRDTAALFRHTMRKRGYTCCPTTCHRRKAEATKKTPGIVTP